MLTAVLGQKNEPQTQRGSSLRFEMVTSRLKTQPLSIMEKTFPVETTCPWGQCWGYFWHFFPSPLSAGWHFALSHGGFSQVTLGLWGSAVPCGGATGASCNQLCPAQGSPGCSWERPPWSPLLPKPWHQHQIQTVTYFSLGTAPWPRAKKHVLEVLEGKLTAPTVNSYSRCDRRQAHAN